jgi:hypothetical protein
MSFRFAGPPIANRLWPQFAGTVTIWWNGANANIAVATDAQ